MKPDKLGVVIIQFLGERDKKTGRYLYDKILKYKQFEKQNLSRDFYDVHSKIEFVETLQIFIERIKNENYYFILHIESHGNRYYGLGNNNEFIGWEEFFDYTRKINILFDGTLLLIMAMCHGNSVIQAINIDSRSPFNFIIGSFREISEDQIEREFEAFYSRFFFEFNTEKALEAMNNEINCLPPLFWIISNEYCFASISAPKHDSPIFWRLMCTEMNTYYLQHPYTSLSLSEVATNVDNSLQCKFKESQRYRNQFLFKDILKNKYGYCLN